MAAVVGAAVVLLGGIALATLSTIWAGFVLSVLWGWFAVPLFGLPEIGVAGAIGLALIVSVLAHQHIPNREPAEIVIASVVGSTIALFIGWIVQGFMA